MAEGLRHRRHVATVRATQRAVPYASRASRPATGDPVLLVPGFLAGAYTLASMARRLRGRPREVRTSHIGMALDPTVLAIVVEALADIHARPLPLRRPGWAVPESDVG